MLLALLVEVDHAEDHHRPHSVLMMKEDRVLEGHQVVQKEHQHRFGHLEGHRWAGRQVGRMVLLFVQKMDPEDLLLLILKVLVRHYPCPGSGNDPSPGRWVLKLNVES